MAIFQSPRDHGKKRREVKGYGGWKKGGGGGKVVKEGWKENFFFPTAGRGGRGRRKGGMAILLSPHSFCLCCSPPPLDPTVVPSFLLVSGPYSSSFKLTLFLFSQILQAEEGEEEEGQVKEAGMK